MASKDQQRIVCLQRCLRISLGALGRIAFNSRNAAAIASEAIENVQMEELKTKPTPLQGLVGHGKNV